MNIGLRIKEERERRGWTQEELANRCGYKYKSSISKIESAGDNISSKKLKAVAIALGVPVSTLMGWDSASLSYKSDEAELFNALKDRPEMKMLFKSAKGATKEQIESVARLLESFKQE